MLKSDTLMLVLIPLFALFLLIWIFRQRQAGWIDSLIAAAVIWGFQIVVITELLSFARLYSLIPVLLAWLLAAAATFELNRRFASGCCDFSETPASSGFLLDQFAPVATVLWSFTGAIFLLTFVVAVMAPPNTTDSMAYHLPRVVYWFTHQTVAFFPTPDYQLVVQPPFAEYTMLLTYVLARGDRFVNLVQWFGFAWSAVAAAGIARSLGAGPVTRALAAFLVAVIPNAILQATGAKNDCYLALWVCAAILALLRYKETESPFWLLISGASLGLAMLTKNTAYLFAPFFLAAALLTFSNQQRQRVIRLAPAFAAMVLLIVLPHYVRTFSLSGSPVGFASAYGKADFRFRNDNLSLPNIVANAIRNVALHLTTPSSKWNRQTETSLRSFITAIGVNPDDPESLWTGTKFAIPDQQRHEAVTGNPLHLLLAAGALIVVFRRWQEKQDQLLLYYAAALVLAALAFSTMLRWQPWHTRLHVVLFAAACPLIAVVAARFAPLALTTLCAGLLLVTAAPMVMENQSRSIMMPGNLFDVPRDDYYFFEHAGLRAPFREASTFLLAQSCKQIGIDSSVRRIEYPLMALLKPENREVELQEIGIDNLTQSLPPYTSGKPCTVVCLGCVGNEKKAAEYAAFHGPARAFGEHMVFTSDGSAPVVAATTPVPAPTTPPAPAPPAPTTLTTGCQARLSDGWFNREFLGPDWLVWSNGQGTVSLDLGEPATVQFSGVIASMPKPNQIVASVNGGAAKNLPIDAPLDYSVALQKGRSEVRFKSLKPGFQPAGDSRTLAIGFRNLVIKDKQSGKACPIIF